MEMDTLLTMKRMWLQGQPFRAGVAFLMLMIGAAGAAFAQGKILLYVPDRVNSKMAEFGLDSTTGNPVAFPPQSTNNTPWDIAVTPNNKFMYVGDNGGFIDGFVVDSTGATTVIPGAISGAGSVYGLAIDPNGRYLYASDSTGGQIVAFNINQSTGALTQFATYSATLPRGMAADQNNHLYVALGSSASVAAYTINGDGTLSAIGTAGTGAGSGSGPNRVAVNPTGTLLFASNTFDASVTVFPILSSGALDAAHLNQVTLGAGTQPLGLAVNQTGTVLLVTDFGATSGAGVYAFLISGTSLTPAAGSPFTAGARPTGVTVDPTGRFVYVSNSSSANITQFSLNATTGVLSGASNTALAGGATPYFLLSRPAPAGISGVPALSTWSFALLAILLAGSAVLTYRRAYR